MKGFGDQSTSKKKSKKKTTPSQEQAINQAFKFHAQGNISEAAKLYQNFISQGFNDHRVFSNYGVILQGLGKLQEAELSYRKAIEINPNFAEAHLNLGNILIDLGKLKDACDSYLKSIEIKPDFAEAHLHLGHTLKDLGNLQEAFDYYLKAIDINPQNSNIYPTITTFLEESDLSWLNKSKLKQILNVLLEKNDVPHQELLKAFNFLYSNQIIINLDKPDSDFSSLDIFINDKIIINSLKKIIFCDIKLEEVLTKVRRNICKRIAYKREPINQSELEFIIALGEQCFLNEYVYSLTEEENISVNKIIQRCRDGEVNEKTIAILSCYFPLYKLINRIQSIKTLNSSNKNFQELIKLQISEPIKEIELSKSIKSLGHINDFISQKVKSQYEENPYPRWRYGNTSVKQKVSIAKAINNQIKPNSISYNIRDSKLKVLVAGCGTGKQILHIQRYKNAQVTAIDISLSGLSYAQRKLNELRIDNVELIQMDILEINLLKENFDIIICSGVLHHMDDPSKGLKVLLGVLKKTGFLKLGLYSELARQDIIKVRNYIASTKLQANEDSIRDFRERVMSGELGDLRTVKESSDFYSLSQCRDLCFHAHEYRFTINQLQEIIKSNELEFLGFSLPKQIKSIYEQYFPEDKKQTNLQNWEEFENKHPNTFAGLYQFWVSKI